MSVKILWATIITVALSTLPGWGFANESTDKTLSPYFHVKSGEDGPEDFPLQSTRVQARVSGVIADVLVVQVYQNRGQEPIEADYVFPGSTRAAVYGMEMQIGERRVVAKIQEKKQAQQTYEKAKAEGKSASLLQQHRPNVFRMSVANIMPGDTIQVELRYTELLVPEEGEYEFVYPTVVGPRYSTKTESTAPPEEDWVANPYLAEGTEDPTQFSFNLDLEAGMPLEGLRVPSHNVQPEFPSPTSAQVAIQGKPDRDVIVQYRLSGKAIQAGLILHQGEGKGEGAENFFLFMAQPPERPQSTLLPSRDYTFVLDVSGSMRGFPLDTAKALLRDLIGNLKSSDTFNVLFFAGNSFVLSPHPLAAHPGNIQKAIQAIDQQRGGGGTELLPALQNAFQLSAEREGSRNIIILTDGYVNVEPEAFDLIRKNLGQANVFSFGIGSGVNRHLIEGMARIGRGEPFVVTAPNQISPAVRRFVSYVSKPVLTDIEIETPGFQVYDVEPLSHPDLLAERPILVYGKWKGSPGGNIHIRGRNGEGNFKQTIPVYPSASAMDNPALRYLWARARIKELGDYNLLRRDDERVKEITNLGLTYHLLTQYTSFVAVDEVVRNAKGNPKKVKQPLALPKGVSNSAIGTTPEPSEWALMALVGAFLIYLISRRHRNSKRQQEV
jgi:Ca-activated chloride channel family protein